MYCYYQDQHPRPGGARYIVPVAIGVCRHCGVAVCKEHAYKDEYPGAPLLCHECAQLQQQNGQAVLKTNDIRRPERS